MWGLATLAAGVLVFAAVGPAAADVACNSTPQGRCHEDVSSFSSVVWSRGAFYAVGQASGDPAAAILVKLTEDGEIAERQILALPDLDALHPARIPDLQSRPEITAADPRKIIALADGDLIVLGQVRVEHGAFNDGLGWAARVSQERSRGWSELYTGLDVSESEDIAGDLLFHSGLFARAPDRVIAVGRHTSGADRSSHCQEWSQAVLMEINLDDGTLLRPAVLSGSVDDPLRHRQAWYGIAPLDGDRYLAVGFQAAPDPAGSACQDDLLLSVLSVDDTGEWMVVPHQIGTNDSPEVAFAVTATGGSQAVIAGFGVDVRTGAPAALALGVEVEQQEPEFLEELADPLPPDSSDQTGGDRYRSIARLTNPDRLLLVGSGSRSREAPNVAMWRTLDASFKPGGRLHQLCSRDFRASDIEDAAVSPSQKVMAAGDALSGGKRIGWTGIILDGSEHLARLVRERRAPDSSYTRLREIAAQPSTGRYLIGPLMSDVRYYHRELAAGAQLDLAFSVDSPRLLRIVAHAAAGEDVDLVLTDASGALVDFSRYAANATELIEVEFEAGEYVLSVVANTQITEFDLALVPGQSEDPALLLSTLQDLDKEQRLWIRELLRYAGYEIGGGEISLGADALRALKAAQDGSGKPVEAQAIIARIDELLVEPPEGRENCAGLFDPEG